MFISNKYTLQAGESVYVLHMNYFSVSPLRYVVWPTVPHPSSFNHAFSTVTKVLADKASHFTVKMEVTEHQGNVVANVYSGDELKHSIDLTKVCERIVVGEWETYWQTLKQDLKL